MRSTQSDLKPQPWPQHRTLVPIAHKAMPIHPARSRLVAYNPTMDLVAVVGDNDDVLTVFRLNGEKVLGIECAEFMPEDDDDYSYGYGEESAEQAEQKPKEKVVKGIAWRRDGHFLAIVCADNIIRLVSAYTGKIVHVLPVDGKDPNARATCIGWGVNFTDGRGTQKILEHPGVNVSLDELLASNVKMRNLQALKRDLPREMALLDIESSLPKLSTLLSMGGSDDVFSSRASLDAIFHTPNRATDESVDVLIVGSDDGSLHLRIFDCFEIGNLNLKRYLGPGQRFLPVHHVSHPYASTHALLLSKEKQLHLVTLDLCFITNSGRYLALLASKITQLQNLLRYISHVEKQIRMEWKNAQDLPARFMRSANVDLEEKHQTDFVTAAYHLVVTGDCSAVMKEFLIDIVGDRGHKRWEKAVAGGYENVRRLTHECLLPALERCSVLLSRLTGLAKNHASSLVLGLEVSSLASVQEIVDALTLMGHNILIYSGRELQQYAAFSRWMKYEIDLQSADPDSQSYEEFVEKSDTLDYAQTLSYIQGPLTKSKLSFFIRPALVGIGADLSPAPQRSDVTYTSYKKIAAEINQRSSSSSPIPKLNDLISYLTKDCEVVFDKIAETQRRNILLSSPLPLSVDCDTDVVDMRMLSELVGTKETISVYVATRSKEKAASWHMYRIQLDSTNNVSSMRSVSSASMDHKSGRIIDMKFVDDERVMAIWCNKDEYFLVSFLYRPRPEDDPDLPRYVRWPTLKEAQSRDSTKAFDSVLSEDITASRSTFEPFQHCFNIPGSHPDGETTSRIQTESSLKPVELVINGRQGRRVVCVLYEGGRSYDVFDLDNCEQDDEDEVDDGGDAGSDTDEDMSVD